MKQTKKNNKKRLLVYALIVFLILILLGIIFAIKVMLNFQDASKESYQPTDDNRNQNVSINQPSNKNMSFLIMGLDNKNDGLQRTDSMIVATYNVKNNHITMTRIPRDLYIKTDKYEGKINALYENQGLSETINVVQDYFGIPISNYATTDFKGLTKVVDKVGGIDIDSDIVIDETNNSNLGSNIQVKKGKNHLNGKEALGYARIRYIDNDIERGNRQMQVIKTLGYKIMSPSQIISVDENIKYMSKYIKTDMKISDVISHINNAKGVPEIENSSFKWDSFNYNNQDFVYLDENERYKLSQSLRKNLDLKTDEPITPMQIKSEGVQ